MKMEEADSTPRHSKQQSTMMTMIIIIIIITTIIMVVVQQKSTNNFLAQLLAFNSSPYKVKLSLYSTNQNDMKAHAQKLHAFLTGQWSAARSGRHTSGIHYTKGWVGSTAGLHVLESILLIAANRTTVLLSHNQALHA